MTYSNVQSGDKIFLSSGVALAEYTVNFSANSFDLEFEGAFAIPEPGTLSLLGLALLVLRRQFRKRCLAA